MFPRVTKLSDFTSANALPFQDVNPVSKWFLNLVGLEQAGDPVNGLLHCRLQEMGTSDK